MIRLLVSVRDVAETQAAVAGGADIIDVKEPDRGALGAASPAVWQAVAACCHESRPLSLALGELTDIRPMIGSRVPATAQHAKLGLHGCRRIDDWSRQWHQHLASLPIGVAPVAVAYADWREADAPLPADVLQHACRAQCGMLLLDTWTKDGRTLLDWITPTDLQRFIATAHQARLQVAIAGSIDNRSIRQILPMKPDVIAVRTAACAGGRQGVVDTKRVSDLARLVHAESE